MRSILDENRMFLLSNGANRKFLGGVIHELQVKLRRGIVRRSIQSILKYSVAGPLHTATRCGRTFSAIKLIEY